MLTIEVGVSSSEQGLTAELRPLQVSLSPGMSVGDRPPGLPKRPSRLSGPFGSAEAAASTGSFTRADVGLKVCQASCLAHQQQV